MKQEEKNNLRHYEALRSVPENALKPIQAGRLKGMSNISPVWRIKAMTEEFGPCGIGWKYEIVNRWTETYGEEIKAFIEVNLYIKDGEEWSAPIPGTGGSSLVTKESKGLYVSDEAYKMALTDAMSVAMKSLGVAADVYFKGDNDSKYQQYTEAAPPIEEAFAALDAAKTPEEYQGVWAKYCKWYEKNQDFYNKAIEAAKRVTKK